MTCRTNLYLEFFVVNSTSLCWNVLLMMTFSTSLTLNQLKGTMWPAWIYTEMFGESEAIGYIYSSCRRNTRRDAPQYQCQHGISSTTLPSHSSRPAIRKGMAAEAIQWCRPAVSTSLTHCTCTLLQQICWQASPSVLPHLVSLQFLEVAPGYDLSELFACFPGLLVDPTTSLLVWKLFDVQFVVV